MSSNRAAAALLALALAAAPTPALASDQPLSERIEELERQQKEFNEELERLRKELEQAPVVADEPEPETETGGVEEVERRQGILTEEVRKLREALVLPEKQELKGLYGLGPAASKVYQVNRGLSIGGYGEASFKNVVSDANGNTDVFDFLRFVLYFGYKFTDRIVLNSEIEFEHATSGSTVSSSDGSVSVEFATLDFLFHQAVNARAGLVLVPFGFINQVHEPPYFLGNNRPPVERQIIPTTWRSNGLGLFGEPLPGLVYNAYGITSFNAKGYSRANLRGARQKGNRERAEDWSFVGQVNYEPKPEWGWSFGGSVYLGDQGQGEEYGPASMQDEVGVFTQMYEIHTQVRKYNWQFRALGTTVSIDDARILSEDPDIKGPIGKQWLGAYAELGYDIMPLIWPQTNQSLVPWFRYSWLDTQNNMPQGIARDRRERRDYYEVGLQYYPIPQVVFKGEYRIEDREEGTAPDSIFLGGGYVF